MDTGRNLVNLPTKTGIPNKETINLGIAQFSMLCHWGRFLFMTGTNGSYISWYGIDISFYQPLMTIYSGFQKIRVPKIGCFVMEKPTKMDDLDWFGGYSHLWNPPQEAILCYSSIETYGDLGICLVRNPWNPLSLRKLHICTWSSASKENFAPHVIPAYSAIQKDGRLLASMPERSWNAWGQPTKTMWKTMGKPMGKPRNDPQMLGRLHIEMFVYKTGHANVGISWDIIGISQEYEWYFWLFMGFAMFTRTLVQWHTYWLVENGISKSWIMMMMMMMMIPRIIYWVGELWPPVQQQPPQFWYTYIPWWSKVWTICMHLGMHALRASDHAIYGLTMIFACISDCFFRLISDSSDKT